MMLQPSVWQGMAAMLIYCISYFMMSPMMGEAILRSVCEDYYKSHNVSHVLATPLFINSLPVNATCNIPEVADPAATWVMWLSVTKSVVSILSTCIMGVLADRWGRRFAMLTPSIGIVLETGLAAIIFQFQFSLNYLYASNVVGGLFGGAPTFFMACFSYAADLTLTSGRSVGFGRIEAMLFIGSGIGPLIGGEITDSLGYPLSLTVCASFGLLSTVCCFVLRDSINDENKASTFRWKNANIFGTMSILLEPGGVKIRRYGLLFLGSAFTMTYLNLMGFFTVFVLYVKFVYNWNDDLVGYFFTTGALVRGISVMVLFPLIFRQFYGRELLVILCALAVLAAAYICYSFAANTWQMMTISILDGLGGSCVPLYRSLMSQNVAAHEQGRICTAIASLEAVFGLIAPFIFNSLFSATASTLPNSIFYIMIAFIGIAVVFTLLVPAHSARAIFRPFDYDVVPIYDPDENQATQPTISHPVAINDPLADDDDRLLIDSDDLDNWTLPPVTPTRASFLKRGSVTPPSPSLLSPFH